jgi:mono/diheme cytochrome c family protein
MRKIIKEEPRIVALVTLLSLVSVGATGVAAQSAVSLESTEYRAVLDRYCITCHSDRLMTAALSLESLDGPHVADAAEVWEKVIRKLRSREMPPPGRPRPSATAYNGFVRWLETEIDRVALAAPNPGTETIHRLNRTEYTNAIRDLLALEIDGREFLPADDQSYGFDNIADVLSLSPALLERYMLAAGKIAQLAIGDPSIRPITETYTTSPVLMQHDRMSDLHPFGTRGGFATRHYFPVDGEYEIRVTLERTVGDTIKGLQNRNRLEVRLDRTRVADFRIGAQGQREPWNALF